MDTPVLPRTVMNGDRPLHFRAAVLAAATTKRPGVPRWTELTVYRLPLAAEEPPKGGYVVAKVGASILAHLPTCYMANPRRMATIADSGVLPSAPVPHLGCNPDVSAPGVLLERTRHEVLQARNPAELVRILMRGEVTEAKLMGMTAEVVDQVRRTDTDFDHWWAASVAPLLPPTQQPLPRY